MSFTGLIGALLSGVQLLNQAQKLLGAIVNEKEKAREELKKQGIDVDLRLAVLKTPSGVKGAIIVDLPGSIEQSIADVLKLMGVDVEVYTVTE